MALLKCLLPCWRQVGTLVQLFFFFFSSSAVSESQTSYRELKVPRGNVSRASGRKLKALSRSFATLLTIVIKWLLIHCLVSALLLYCEVHRIRVMFDLIHCVTSTCHSVCHTVKINIWWMNEFNINVLTIVIENYGTSYWLLFEQGHFEILWTTC